MLLTGACADLPVNNSNTDTTASTTPAPRAVSKSPVMSSLQDQSQANTQIARQHEQQRILEMGSGTFIAEPARDKPAVRSNTEDLVTLNFQSTDVREFVEAILGDILEVNYVIDPAVSGNVTIDTSKPISRDKLVPLLEELLAMNSAVLVRANDFYQVIPRKTVSSSRTLPASTDQRPADGYGVRIIPLQYIAAQEMQKILEPFVTDVNDIRID